MSSWRQTWFRQWQQLYTRGPTKSAIVSALPSVSHRTAVNTDGEVTNAEVEDQERTQTLDTEFWCCK